MLFLTMHTCSVFVEEVGGIRLLIIVDESVNLDLNIGIIIVIIIFVDSVVLLLETLGVLNGFLGQIIVVAHLNLGLNIAFG